MGRRGSGVVGRTIHKWKSWSLIVVGSAILTLVASCGQASAMGLVPNGGMDLLLPNTVTVEGSATEPISHPVSEITYAMTVTDSSMKSVLSDIGILKHHEILSLAQDGIPTGDILFSSPSFNAGNGSPQSSVQLTVIVGDATKVATVFDSLGSYQPSFATNNYSNVQVVPLNPAAMWPEMYKAALDNAESQAAELASQAGMQLGSVISISTVPEQGMLQVLSGPYPSSPSVAGMQLEYGNAGQIGQVSVQIYVSFSLVKPTS